MWFPKLSLAATLLLILGLPVLGQDTAGQNKPDTAAVTSAQGGGAGAALLTEAFLATPENVEAGRELWNDTCRHCHGRAAYPGKAPKLKPKTYTPQFTYDRITKGFRQMPPWEDVYSDEQRAQLVAYILSRNFSP